MVSLQRKRTNGHDYWYLVESRRIHGKPRPVVLAYLGKPDQLLQRLREAPRARLEIRSFAHGGVAALSSLARRLGVAQTIDRHVPESRHRISVGTTLLLAALNRALRPRSKRGWASWARTTTIEKLFRLRADALTSQHFWDQMDLVSEKALAAIEEDLTATLVGELHLSLETLFYDTTNFFTYIASDNERCDLPQRGRNKQRRMDLRQFNLALLVSRDGPFPLAWQLYRGDVPDAKVFPDTLSTIRRRLEKVVGSLEGITIVYDKGNNSRKNQAALEGTGLHYVGSLVPSQHADLVGIPAGEYRPIEEGSLRGLRVLRLRKTLWGKERTLVLLVSEKLREGQIRGLAQHLQKRLRLLQRWGETLKAPRSGPRTLESARRKIARLLAGQHLEKILHIEYHPERSGSLRLHWSVDEEARRHLHEEVFGKRILMTDREDWSTEQIVLAYRGQSRVELAYRRIKDPEHLAVRPQYHWTDQKIRVHAFCCVVAYILCTWVECEARRAGFKEDLPVLLDRLDEVRLACILDPPEKRSGPPRARWQLETTRPDVERLYRLFVPKESILGYTGVVA
jgi:transposase